VNVFPGKTTVEDWSDELYVFYMADDHGKEEISRKVKERYFNGRAKPADRGRYVFCEEHASWEQRYRRITGREALTWATR
jgi:hypothetical protein